MGRKMVYNFLGLDKQTEKSAFNQNVCTVYWNLHAVYPNNKHVTTHRDFDKNVFTIIFRY